MKVYKRVKGDEEVFVISLTRTEATKLYQGFGGVVEDPKMIADLANVLATILKK